MKPPGSRRPIPVLGSLRRTARLTWVELRKLLSHKLFPAALILTLVVTTGLAIAAKAFTRDMGTRGFSNYSLWVTSGTYGLQVGIILLVALGAMAMSTEATGRTLNTVLARPLRRIELAAAKILSLIVATVAIVLVAGLASYVVGGTVQDPSAASEWQPEGAPAGGFPSYGDVLKYHPAYGWAVLLAKGVVIGEILFGFLLLIVPVLAAVSVGFLIGTLVDSTGLAVGLSVGIFMSLEVSKFIPVVQHHLGPFAYNYPISRISTLMLEASGGTLPRWDDALTGVAISAGYIAVSLAISLIVFCRRDITL
ncbi:MAG: ABC transporter permease [Planctomycetes bacterium]|nr:ABC transporter permease [Planctomycetota bacterium]